MFEAALEHRISNTEQGMMKCRSERECRIRVFQRIPNNHTLKYAGLGLEQTSTFDIRCSLFDIQSPVEHQTSSYA
jgi:hypothetical protein